MALVSKADGTTEPFDPSKLRHSLERAGAAEDMVEKISKEIELELYSGISTSQIYRRAFALLHDYRRGVAARYSLKRAVDEFGPSGFPFEAYLAKLFEQEGYKTKIDQIVQGACVEHEVDVVLSKGREKTFVEAKFHNNPGYKTDLKTVLYVKARIDDLQKAMPGTPVHGLVVTNTKFTSKAIQYASCAGLELLGWDYPEGRDLHVRIDVAKLYPVTALTTLNKNEKMALLNKKMVLCSDLAQNSRALSTAGVHGKRAELILEEVGALCIPGKDI